MTLEQSTKKAVRTPAVRRTTYTYDLKGRCVYCDKTVNRTRTFSAVSSLDLDNQVDVAMENLAHKKCEGF